MDIGLRNFLLKACAIEISVEMIWAFVLMKFIFGMI